MRTPRGLLSIGVAGALGPHRIADIAASVHAHGFDGLWVNDTADGDALAALGAAAAGVAGLRLATGVLPIDRVPPDEILRRVERAGLDPARLTIGIGAGSLRVGALDAVTSALETLRSALPTAHVVVGALGPKMRRLGAERGAGVLLNWLDPRGAERQARELRAVSPGAHVALYVRTAVEPDAAPQVLAEAARYARIPAYARNFERLGIDPADTVILGGDAGRVADYRAGPDELVLRVVAADDSSGAIARAIERLTPTAAP